MESQSQKIIKIIEEILKLLKKCDEPDCEYYGNFFEFILSELNKPHELAHIAENILNTYGGMATFSDVAIYKDGKYLIIEGDKFHELREALFIACEDVIASSRGATS